MESLLEMSPRVLAIFSHNPVTMTEGILKHCPIMSMELHELFREVAFIHTPFTPINSLNDYESHISSKDQNPRQKYQFRDRDPSVQTSVMRDMICVAAHIQRLACTCLNTMQRNMQIAASSNTLLPETAVHSAARQVSWIEEYRVYRALWHLKVVSNMKKAAQGIWIPTYPRANANSGWGGWNWTPEDQASISQWYSHRFNPDVFKSEFFISQETWALSSILEIISNTSSGTSSLPSPDAKSVKSYQSSVWSPNPQPLDPGMDISCFYSTKACFNEAPQRADWRHIRAPLVLATPSGPVYMGGYQVLNRLGVFIWDRARMDGMGLALGCFVGKTPIERYYMTNSVSQICPGNIENCWQDQRVVLKRWISLLPIKLP